MAASLNKVFLMGNLTRDPELRYVPSGSAVANFSLAINRVYKDTTGQKKEDTSFVRVVVWGKMAEICGEYLSKGKPVLVEGRLKSRTWETADNQKRSALDVVATSVQFLGSKSDRNPGEQSTPRPSAGANSGSGYGEIDTIDVDDSGGDQIPF